MSRPPLPDSLRPTLPPVAFRTPSKIDITSQPGFITNHTRGTQDNLGFETLGTHQQADKLIDANLDGATYFNIEGLVKAAIPEDAFPLDDSLFLDAVCDAGLYNKERGRWQCLPKLRKPGEEPVIADWLNAIGEAGLALFVKHGIFSSDDKPRVRKWSAAFCNKELPDGVQSRKPDGASFDPLTEASWKVIVNDLQHKSSSEDREAAFKQLHDGAFNILTEQDDRIFHIGLALIGEQFFIVYYNRAGCYRSIPANVHEHAAILVYLVFALALLDKPAVGFDPSITVTGEDRFITLAGKTLRILGPQGREYNLRGSAPVYWRCIDTETNEKFTVKNVWADRSRNPTEWALYERADRAGVEHMPKIVACEFVRDGKALITTDTLRQRLPNPGDVKDCEVRDYMRILIEGHTVPLHDFASKSEVIGAVRDAVKAHQMLCDKAGIIHLQVRDTTVLLDDSDGSKRGSRPGVLVDLGVAKVIDALQAQPPSRGHKSCFGMYEAWEILTSPNAMPRSDHDLESFFYVLIALCSSCSGNDQGALPREDFDLPKSDLGRWLDIDKTTVGSSKWFVLSFKPKACVDSFDEFLDDVIDPFFNDFKPLLRKLRELLAEVSRRPTHQEFIDVLESYVEAKLRTATLPIVDAEDGADEDDERMSDSDEDQFDDDSDAGHTADQDRLPDVAQVLAAPVPRERRKSTQTRAAHFSPYTVDMTCECGAILRLGDSNLIRCRELSCSTGLFHRGCMGQLREPPANSLEAWCCDDCKGKKTDRDWKPLPKRRARAVVM